jgi:CpXC motif protein
LSDLAPALARCPRCHAEQPATLFTSLNADLIAAQHADLLDGTFERTACTACGHAFRPEHRLLYTQLSARTWIVMYPVAERRAFRALENIVLATVERELQAAPPAAAQLLSGVRRRLVFGQHMLTEAVRAQAAGLDPALLECAKLFAIRDHLGRLLGLGPFELCFERCGDEGALHLGVHAFATGERTGELALPGDAIAGLRAIQPDLEARWPDLFTRPYVSACRYLYQALE